MAEYSKLYNTLVLSTVWREPDHVRLVWITILALKDRHGFIGASVPGLADAARIGRDLPEPERIALCEDALRRLASPDPYSRSKEHEGRRIEEARGGWLVLNHSYYRDLMSTAEKREGARVRKQRSRRGKSAAPSNLTEALKLDVCARAKALQRDPHLAQWVTPQEWPEIQELAEAWGEKRLGQYERDSGVRACVEVFAAGFTLDELKHATEQAKRSGWANDKRKNGHRLGLASLTPEVVRRALDDSQDEPRRPKTREDHEWEKDMQALKEWSDG